MGDTAKLDNAPINIVLKPDPSQNEQIEGIYDSSKKSAVITVNHRVVNITPETVFNLSGQGAFDLSQFPRELIPVIRVNPSSDVTIEGGSFYLAGGSAKVPATEAGVAGLNIENKAGATKDTYYTVSATSKLFLETPHDTAAFENALNQASMGAAKDGIEKQRVQRTHAIEKALEATSSLAQLGQIANVPVVFVYKDEKNQDAKIWIAPNARVDFINVGAREPGDTSNLPLLTFNRGKDNFPTMAARLNVAQNSAIIATTNGLVRRPGDDPRETVQDAEAQKIGDPMATSLQKTAAVNIRSILLPVSDPALQASMSLPDGVSIDQTVTSASASKLPKPQSTPVALVSNTSAQKPAPIPQPTPLSLPGFTTAEGSFRNTMVGELEKIKRRANLMKATENIVDAKGKNLFALVSEAQSAASGLVDLKTGKMGPEQHKAAKAFVAALKESLKYLEDNSDKIRTIDPACNHETVTGYLKTWVALTKATLGTKVPGLHVSTDAPPSSDRLSVVDTNEIPSGPTTNVPATLAGLLRRA